MYNKNNCSKKRTFFFCSLILSVLFIYILNKTHHEISMDKKQTSMENDGSLKAKTVLPNKTTEKLILKENSPKIKKQLLQILYVTFGFSKSPFF
jgi:hypothetical protein